MDPIIDHNVNTEYKQISPEKLKFDEVLFSLLAEVGSVDLETDPVLRLFNRWSVQTLSLLLLSDTTTVNALRQFLEKRWQLMVSSQCASDYCMAPEDKMNKACVGLARFIRNITGESLYQLLMPTLAVTKSEITLTDLDNENTPFHHFVLSEDKHHFIEVLPCLYAAEEEGVLKHTTLIDGKEKPLTEWEVKLLTAHSNEVVKYRSAMSNLKLITKSSGSFGSVLNDLITLLKSGGAHANSESKGEELNAGEDSIVAIFWFNEWLKGLTEDEINQLMSKKSSFEHVDFREMWGRLQRPLDVEYTAVRYCVESIAKILSSIYEDNKDWFDTTFSQARADHEQSSMRYRKALIKFEDAKRALTKAYEDEDRILKPTLNKVTALARPFFEHKIDIEGLLDDGELTKLLSVLQREVEDKTVFELISCYPSLLKLFEKMKPNQSSAPAKGNNFPFLSSFNQPASTVVHEAAPSSSFGLN